MSPTRQSTADAELLGRALAGEIDEGRRNVDRDHLGAAPGQFDGERAGAAAGVEHARAARSCGNQESSVARISSRPARTVARMRPTGSLEVSRFQASTAVRSK